MWHKAIDHYRATKNESAEMPFVIEPSQPDGSYASMVDRYNQVDFLTRFYNGLSDEDKTLVTGLAEGLSNEILAAKLNMPITKLRTHLHRKRKIWKKVLEAYEKDRT